MEEYKNVEFETREDKLTSEGIIEVEFKIHSKAEIIPLMDYATLKKLTIDIAKAILITLKIMDMVQRLLSRGIRLYPILPWAIGIIETDGQIQVILIDHVLHLSLASSKPDKKTTYHVNCPDLLMYPPRCYLQPPKDMVLDHQIRPVYSLAALIWWIVLPHRFNPIEQHLPAFMLNKPWMPPSLQLLVADVFAKNVCTLVSFRKRLDSVYDDISIHTIERIVKKKIQKLH